MKKWAAFVFLILVFTACTTAGISPDVNKKQNLAQIQTMMALELLKQKNYRAALESVNKAITADSGFADAWMVKGIVYQAITDYPAAGTAFKQALALDADNAEINNNYGWFLCDARKNYAGAVTYFNRALADLTYPTPELAYMNMGICQSRAGEYGQAEANLQRSLRLNPAFPYPFAALARLKYRQGQYREAAQLFKNYLGQVVTPRAEDLQLGYDIAVKTGSRRDQDEYLNRLRVLYPYNDESLRPDGRDN